MPNGDFDIQPLGKEFDFAKQLREGEQFLTGFGEHIGGLPSPAQTYLGFGEQLGIPGLQTSVQQLREIAEQQRTNVLAQPGIVAGTTRESLVTEPQRARLVQAQQQPILEQLGETARSLNVLQPALASAQQLASTLTGLEIQQQKIGLLPFEMGFTLLEQRQGREFSGYTFEMEQELNRLISNQQAGVTLSEGEKNRANQLAMAEAGYANNLEQIRLRGEQERETKKAPADLGTLFGRMFS